MGADMQQWLMANLETVAASVSALLALVALAAGWLSWRRAELRRDDVHDWATEAIGTLQTLRLLTAGRRLRIPAAEERARLHAVMFDSSILVERGRLFFRNARRRSGKGADKPAAYRGSRPDILDQLVLAHQIACAWPTADADARARMRVLAADAAQRFVTLVQQEVGRQRTVSAHTRRGGRWSELEERMAAVDPARLMPPA